MEKFATEGLVIEVIERFPAHMCAKVKVNGEEMIMKYSMLSFLERYKLNRSYAKGSNYFN